MGGGAAARDDDRDRLNVRSMGGGAGTAMAGLDRLGEAMLDEVDRVGEKMSGLGSYPPSPTDESSAISPEPRWGVGRMESTSSEAVLDDEGESDMGEAREGVMDVGSIGIAYSAKRM